MTTQSTETGIPRIEKWKIAVPAALAILSIVVNCVLYLDNRDLKIKRDELGARLDSVRLSSEIFRRKLDSLDKVVKTMALKATYPLFEFSYYQMDYITYGLLRDRSEAVYSENKLDNNHPLSTSKYLNTGVDAGNASIMLLMLKQVGGSIASDIKVEVTEFNLNQSVGFSFQSDITGLLANNTKGITKEIQLGQMEASKSVIIPLFSFENTEPGSFDSYRIKGKIYIPKKVTFTALDGTIQTQSIREMLKDPFSISVSIDERG
jgi:hypothetical protein